MKRLIPILIVILIGSTLPVYARNCCNPGPSEQCHHSKAPRDKTRCQPSFSACPGSVCVMHQKRALALSTQSKQPGREVLVLSAAADVLTPASGSIAPGLNMRPPTCSGGRLFLRNHAFLI
jgi:hypothetical protein